MFLVSIYVLWIVFESGLYEVRFLVDCDLVVLLILVWCNLEYFGEGICYVVYTTCFGKYVVGCGIIVSSLVLLMFCSEMLVIIIFCVVLGNLCGWYMLQLLGLDMVLCMVNVNGFCLR